MAAMNTFALFEALKGASRLFMGGDGKEEDKLTQQTASALIPSFDDEAIQTALDTVLYDIDPLHLRRVQLVRSALAPHQQDRWRKVLTTLKLTEKFENVTVSEKTVRAPSNQNGAGESQSQEVQLRRRSNVEKRAQSSGREETTRTFDRRKRDYEYTPEDPRVAHLVFISKLVASKPSEPEGISEAKNYLLGAGMILEKSLAAQTTEKVERVTNATLEKAYGGAAKLILGTDEYDRIIGTTESEPPLEAAIKAKNAAKKQERDALRANRFPSNRVLLAAICICLIVALASAAYLI